MVQLPIMLGNIHYLSLIQGFEVEMYLREQYRVMCTVKEIVLFIAHSNKYSMAKLVSNYIAETQ